MVIAPAASEVLRLAQAGTSDAVLLAFVQNSPAIFNLSADNILYLKDLGLSSQVLAGMLNHDTLLRNRLQALATNQTAYPPPPMPMPAAEAPPPDAGTAPDYVGNPPEDVNWFYSDLAPYGAWALLEGVGWCWQPSIVLIAHDWRPYCDGGHWICTDQGWYWQSEYSWGWAPFHYGRWYLHPRCGWVWQPDRKWGPAWVAWRAFGDYCGWAPLPPTAVFAANAGWRFQGKQVGLDSEFGLRPGQFTFVPLQDFEAKDVSRHRLPETEVAAIYKQTTAVNNYTGHKDTIINRGIPVERIAAAAHRTITKATIRDLPANGAGPGPGSVPVLRGRQEEGAIVYRRPLTAPARPANIVAQKVDARHPMIVHRVPAMTWAIARPSTAGQNQNTQTRTSQK
jgi:hypothetical protein